MTSCIVRLGMLNVQLVYKHAISTVMPASVIQLFDPSKGEAEDAV